MTNLNEGSEVKYNHDRPDTKDKDFLTKLNELAAKVLWETSIERDAEGNVQGFKRGGYTGDLKTQAKDFLTKLNEEGAKALKNEDEKPKDWQAITTELQREKNKLAVRIAEIEGELKRRAERTMTERQIIDTITESLDVLNYEDMSDGIPFTSVNQPEWKRTFTIELKPGATLLYVDGVISAESANKMAEEFLQVFEEARAEVEGELKRREQS